MEDRYADKTDMNYMGLTVPADGTLAVVCSGSKYWAPAEGDADARGESERWLELMYEPVLSMDGKLIDIVAWHAPEPSLWWLRTGRGIVLGAPQLMMTTFTGYAVHLVAAPAGWRDMRGRDATLDLVCVLDWATVDTRALFEDVWGGIYCFSEPLRQRLIERQKELGGSPLVTFVDTSPL